MRLFEIKEGIIIGLFVLMLSISEFGFLNPLFGQKIKTNKTADQKVEAGFITTDDATRLFYQKVGKGQPTVIIPGGLFLFEDFKHLANGRTLIF